MPKGGGGSRRRPEGVQRQGKKRGKDGTCRCNTAGGHMAHVLHQPSHKPSMPSPTHSPVQIQGKDLPMPKCQELLVFIPGHFGLAWQLDELPCSGLTGKHCPHIPQPRRHLGPCHAHRHNACKWRRRGARGRRATRWSEWAAGGEHSRTEHILVRHAGKHKDRTAQLTIPRQKATSTHTMYANLNMCVLGMPQPPTSRQDLLPSSLGRLPWVTTSTTATSSHTRRRCPRRRPWRRHRGVDAKLRPHRRRCCCCHGCWGGRAHQATDGVVWNGAGSKAGG